MSESVIKITMKKLVMIGNLNTNTIAAVHVHTHTDQGINELSLIADRWKTPTLKLTR